MALIKKAKPADAVEELPEPDPAEDAPMDEVTAEAAAEEDDDSPLITLEAEPAAGSDDSLLSMFTEVGIETIDRSVLTGLAGEVDMTDLISELNLVAAALGIVMSERQQHTGNEAELLAA